MKLDWTDPAVIERAKTLLSDGQLATWVGEDVGLSRTSVYLIAKEIPDREEHVLAWQQVWAQIRRNPVLLELHREFNPKRPKGVATPAPV